MNNCTEVRSVRPFNAKGKFKIRKRWIFETQRVLVVGGVDGTYWGLLQLNHHQYKIVVMSDVKEEIIYPNGLNEARKYNLVSDDIYIPDEIYSRQSGIRTILDKHWLLFDCFNCELPQVAEFVSDLEKKVAKINHWEIDSND